MSDPNCGVKMGSGDAEIDRLQQRNAELTAEVERLRADAGRLDWMDEHSRRTSEIKGRPADDGDGSCSVWFVVGEPGQTLRATLDAAIKEAGNG